MLKQARFEYENRLAAGLHIASSQARRAYRDQVTDAYLQLLGSQKTLEEIRREHHQAGMAQYEELLRRQYNLSLEDAAAKLQAGMQQRDAGMTPLPRPRTPLRGH